MWISSQISRKSTVRPSGQRFKYKSKYNSTFKKVGSNVGRVLGRVAVDKLTKHIVPIPLPQQSVIVGLFTVGTHMVPYNYTRHNEPNYPTLPIRSLSSLKPQWCNNSILSKSNASSLWTIAFCIPSVAEVVSSSPVVKI